MVWNIRTRKSGYSNICRPLGSLNSYTRFVWIEVTEGYLNDLIVFIVGLVVSTLVVFGIFLRVVSEMQDAKNQDAAAAKHKDQQISSQLMDRE